MYNIQICWSDGSIHSEWLSDKTNLDDAINEAKEESTWNCFEGDYVIVLDQDCDVVWDSRKELN